MQAWRQRQPLQPSPVMLGVVSPGHWEELGLSKSSAQPQGCLWSSVAQGQPSAFFASLQGQP